MVIRSRRIRSGLTIPDSKKSLPPAGLARSVLLKTAPLRKTRVSLNFGHFVARVDREVIWSTLSQPIKKHAVWGIGCLTIKSL